MSSFRPIANGNVNWSRTQETARAIHIVRWVSSIERHIRARCDHITSSHIVLSTNEARLKWADKQKHSVCRQPHSAQSRACVCVESFSVLGWRKTEILVEFLHVLYACLGVIDYTLWHRDSPLMGWEAEWNIRFANYCQLIAFIIQYCFNVCPCTFCAAVEYTWITHQFNRPIL